MLSGLHVRSERFKTHRQSAASRSRVACSAVAGRPGEIELHIRKTSVAKERKCIRYSCFWTWVNDLFAWC